MSDDLRVRNGFRRRRTTRRLLRHPARVAARPDQSQQQLKLEAGAATRLQASDDEAMLEAPMAGPDAVVADELNAGAGEREAASGSPLTAADGSDAQPLMAADAGPASVGAEEDFSSDAETTDGAERDLPEQRAAELEAAAADESEERDSEAADAATARDSSQPTSTVSADAAAATSEGPAVSDAAASDSASTAGESKPDAPSISLEQDTEPPEPEPLAAAASDDDDAAAETELGFEPSTTELQRPPPESGAVDAALNQAGSALAFSPILPPSDAAADGGAEGAATSFPGNDESEIKTKPKIRLPEGAPRRAAAPPPPARFSLPVPDGRVSSPLPPRLAARATSPIPPAPAGHSIPPQAQPSGEGIVRTSQLPLARRPNDRDSEAPTRPRIPLTHDMALAAGRITSQEVVPFGYEDVSLLRPRVPSAAGAADASVLVTRARMISDRPGAETAGAVDPAAQLLRRSRRPRPDSEEFETLDLEDGVEDTARLELSGVTAKGSTENGVRVSRTPPPPPSASQGKRATASTASQGAVQRAAPPPPPPNAAAKKPAPVATAKAQPKKRAWWEVLFSDDYVRTLPRLSSSTVAKQVSFMELSLGIKRGDAVLDVGCGLGQHALEFARRGYLVVALDLALSMITRAAEEAQQRGLRINFLHKDIRDIGFEGTFDAIICVGTTFGFFDDEQNRNVFARLAHALKPGGKLLIDVVNRDYVIRSQPNLVWFEGEGCVVMEESDFNYYSSRLNVKRTMMREDGRQSDSEYSIRLYSVHELGQLLKQAGFSIKEVSGQEATRGLFFGSHSTRIIMLAERRIGPRNDHDQSTPPGADG